LLDFECGFPYNRAGESLEEPMHEAPTVPGDVTLRDGRTVHVREMTTDDGPALIEFFRSLPLVDRLFLRHDVTRPDVVERFVRNADRDQVFSIVAQDGKRIVASAELQRERYVWMTHIGEVRFVVAHDFQCCGLGVLLCRVLVKAAMGHGIDKLEAHVMEGQTSAERAMQRLGFVREAILKGHVKDVRGKRRDLHIYTNDVAHIWESMDALVADFSPMRE
jgi:RimJ/RimL family protein N-acetyltransferase